MNTLVEAMVRTDTPGNVGDPDVRAIKDALRQIHDRFVDERVKGWTHPETGQTSAPVSQEEAEARWQKAQSKFAQLLLKAPFNDIAQRRLRMHKGALPASSTYRETNVPEPQETDVDWAEYEKEWHTTPGERAMRDEPSLRRGESKARQMIKQLIG